LKEALIFFIVIDVFDNRINRLKEEAKSFDVKNKSKELLSLSLLVV